MRWITRLALVVCIGIGLAPSGVAAAQSGAPQGGAALLTDKLSLTAGDNGTATGTVTLLNSTTQPIAATLTTAAAGTGCGVSPASVALDAGREKAVEVTLTGCANDGDGVVLTVAAGGQSWTLSGQLDKPAAPPWSWLWAFAGAAVLGGLAVVVAWSRWDGGDAARSWRTPLPGLKADYDFSKSWASNATVLATAFAGFFGATDVRKAILGKDDDGIVAVVLVAAALATALVAAAPFMAAAFRSSKDDAILSVGLIGAVFLTMTGTGGQFAVLILTAVHIDIGPFRWVALVFGVLGGLLLMKYTYQKLYDALVAGVVHPQARHKPPTKAAAKAQTDARAKLAAANIAHQDVSDAYPEIDASAGRTSRGDDRPSAVF